MSGNKGGIRRGLEKIFHGANYRWWVQATVCIGVFMASLDMSVANIALPTIMSEFKANLTSAEWVVLIYLLITTSLYLSMGRLADMMGKKRIYTLGFIVFIIASAMSGLSQSMTQLIASRGLQAIGASMLGSSSFAIVNMAFPAHERGRALGLHSSMAALGIILGPTVGGILVQVINWRAIFFVNVPVGLLGGLMTFLVLRESQAEGSVSRTIRQFDYFGALLVTAMLTSLLLSVTSVQRGLGSSLLVRSGFVLSALALTIFLFWQIRVKEPLLDLKLFKNRLFAAGSFARVFGFAATGANTLAMPFYLQLAMGYSPLTSGLMMSASGLSLAICAPISGWIADRTGERLIASFGLSLNILAFFLLAFFTPHSYAAIIVLLTMMGIGWGIFQAPNTSSVMNSVPKERYGIASGLIALTRSLGQVSGVAMASVFLVMAVHSATGSDSLEGLRAGVVYSPARAQLLDAFLSGFRHACMAAGLLCLAAIVASLVRAGGEKTKNMINR